jgi:hypothetical protein
VRGGLTEYLVTARSTDKRWSLAISFHQFTGRHRYELNYGSDADPHLSFTGPDREFSSLNRPRRSFAGPVLRMRRVQRIGMGTVTAGASISSKRAMRPVERS